MVILNPVVLGDGMDKFEIQLNNILADLFNRMIRVEERALSSVSGPRVTATEAHILDAIGQKDVVMSVSEVAAALHITVPTITVALKRLVDKGLVTKTACQSDGRRFLVALTRQGEKIFEAHRFFHKKMVEAATAGFTDEEKDALLSCLKKLSDFFTISNKREDVTWE